MTPCCHYESALGTPADPFLLQEVLSLSDLHACLTGMSLLAHTHRSNSTSLTMIGDGIDTFAWITIDQLRLWYILVVNDIGNVPDPFGY